MADTDKSAEEQVSRVVEFDLTRLLYCKCILGRDFI